MSSEYEPNYEYVAPKKSLEKFAYDLASNSIADGISNLHNVLLQAQNNYYVYDRNMDIPDKDFHDEIGMTKILGTEEKRRCFEKRLPQPLSELFRTSDSKGITTTYCRGNATFFNDEGFGVMIISDMENGTTRPRFLSYYARDLFAQPTEEAINAQKFISDLNSSPDALVEDYYIAQALLSIGVLTIAYGPTAHPHNLI